MRCFKCDSEGGTKLAYIGGYKAVGGRNRQSLCDICYTSHLRGIERRADLQRRYGISEGHYDRLLVEQDFSCKICGKSHSEHKRLVVDHCHTTGAIRGLLCNKCNFAVGFMENSPEIAIKASYYLDEFRQAACRFEND